MKLTKSKLKQIIKEELQNVLNEAYRDPTPGNMLEPMNTLIDKLMSLSDKVAATDLKGIGPIAYTMYNNLVYMEPNLLDLYYNNKGMHDKFRETSDQLLKVVNQKLDISMEKKRSSDKNFTTTAHRF